MVVACDSGLGPRIVTPYWRYWRLKKISVTDVLGLVWVSICNNGFYIHRVRWLGSDFNILLGSLKWGCIQVSVVEAVKQQSRYENEKALTASLVKQDRTRAYGRRSRQRGQCTSKRFICTQFCSLLFWSVCFCSLQNESAWCFINLLKSGVKWCGTHQRGEAKQIWKRAEYFISCPVSLPPLFLEPGEAELMSTQFQFTLLLPITPTVVHLK